MVEQGSGLIVEMWQRLAVVQHATIRRLDRRPIGIVEKPFHEIRRRREVFKALLILNADRGTTKFFGNA